MGGAKKTEGLSVRFQDVGHRDTFGRSSTFELAGPTQRICRACAVLPIATAALPCRHSALCRKCMHEKLHTDRKCPDCGKPIDYAMHGSFETDSVDLAPIVIKAITQTLSCLSHCLYEIAYGNLVIFVVMSLVAGVVSVLAIQVFEKPSCAYSLGYFALFLGYIPCLVVFSVAFEERDSRMLIAREDFDSPCYGVTKCTCLIIMSPFVFLLLFIPYVTYVVLFRKVIFVVVLVVLRVFLRIFLHFGCCLYMWVLRPPLVGLGAVLRQLAGCMFGICSGIARLLGEGLAAVPTFHADAG